MFREQWQLVTVTWWFAVWGCSVQWVSCVGRAILSIIAMTRFDSPGQVVLLFTGAAVVSVVLIALLNVEARNRKIKGRNRPFHLQRLGRTCFTIYLSLDSKLLQLSSYCAHIITVLPCYTLLTRERERHFKITILVTFAKCRKATTKLRLVYLSVRMDQLDSHWRDFREV